MFFAIDRGIHRAEESLGEASSRRVEVKGLHIATAPESLHAFPSSPRKLVRMFAPRTIPRRRATRRATAGELVDHGANVAGEGRAVKLRRRQAANRSSRGS